MQLIRNILPLYSSSNGGRKIAGRNRLDSVYNNMGIECESKDKWIYLFYYLSA
jgi:hypothetical protein